jgi:hypothetical protein
MKDSTIIRIKVPARLYESVKAKLMIKEDASIEETKVEEKVEETETLEESPVMDILTALAGVGGIAASGAAISAWQDKLKQKNPDLYNKLSSIHGAVAKAKGLNEAKDDKKAAEDKKKAEEKKKKEAEAKKVADKKAADKKKAAEKKK